MNSDALKKETTTPIEAAPAGFLEPLRDLFDARDMRMLKGRGGDIWFGAKEVAEAVGNEWQGRKTFRRIPNQFMQKVDGGVENIHPGQSPYFIHERGLYIYLGRLKDSEKAVDFQIKVAKTLERVRKGVTSSASAASKTMSKIDVLEGAIEVIRDHEERLGDVEKAQEETTDRLDDVEQTLEEGRAAPQATTTRFGHEVKGHSWDGMRKEVISHVSREQERYGGGYSELYGALYRTCEREFGFHPRKVQRRRGGPSMIKALDFDQMRTLLEVARWMYPDRA